MIVAEQQVGHMELRQSAYWKSSHCALTFVSSSQSRQEQRRKQLVFYIYIQQSVKKIYLACLALEMDFWRATVIPRIPWSLRWCTCKVPSH